MEEYDEIEVIYQKFLDNHEKRKNEQKKKLNEENVSAKMQQFKFVST